MWLGSELYYLAFMDLTSCRSTGQTIPGTIPWSSIHLYCEANEIVGDQRDDLFYHVQNLDKSYLDWFLKKHKQEMAAHKPPKPVKGRRGR